MIKPMQPLISYPNLSARPDVMHARRIYGLFYGSAIALAFAAWTWGIDSYLLSRANAIQPWLKFAVGFLVCLPVGAFAGWLVMRIERGWASALIWLLAALVFAWISVALPFQIVPRLTMLLHPIPGGLPHTLDEGLMIRVGLAYAWVAIFVLIAGLLELPIGEAAAFSTSLFGRVGPSLLCIALMGICGFMVDGLNNEPLRSPLLLTDQTIQFALDNQGKQIPSKVARDNHLYSLNTVRDLISRPRELVVGAFDSDLGQIHVLVEFGDEWVDCLTVYGQMSNCNKISP